MSTPRKRTRTPPLAIDPSLEGQRAGDPASHAVYGVSAVSQQINQMQAAARRRVPAAFQVNASLERAHTAYEAPLQVYGWPTGMGAAMATATATRPGSSTFAANPLLGLPAGLPNAPTAIAPTGSDLPGDSFRSDQVASFSEASVLEKALAFRTADVGTSADALQHQTQLPRLPTPPPLPPAAAQASESGGKQAAHEETAPAPVGSSSIAASRERSEEAERLGPTDAFTQAPDPFDDAAGAFPERADFDVAIEAYMHKLHPIKRNKALMTRDLHDTVREILRNPLNTKLGDPQLRFWVRQRFRLMHGPDGLDCVLHEGKRVALRNEIYDVLAAAHHSSQHGGRDKTYATLRERWSYIPKETVTSFIKLCPTCNGKRVTDKQVARDRPPKKRRSNVTEDDISPMLGEQVEVPPASIAPELYGLPEGLVKAFASYPADVAPRQPVQSASATPDTLSVSAPRFEQSAQPGPAESTSGAEPVARYAVGAAVELPDPVGQQLATEFAPPAYATFVTAAAVAAAQAAEQG